MSEIKLNSEQFHRRCQKLYAAVGQPLMIMLGKAVDSEEFGLNSALFHYLLGYEFPETILVVSKTPTMITSPKKALIVQQIGKLNIITKQKDDGNLAAILSSFTETYGVADLKQCTGQFCEAVLSKVIYQDITAEILKIMSIKEKAELEYMRKAGQIANSLLVKGINLVRDQNFSKEELENCMGDAMRGIDNNLIEFSFEPEYSENHIRLGIRYRGYCCEIARPFLTDLAEHYAIQQKLTEILRPGRNSLEVLEQLNEFAGSMNFNQRIQLYSIGLVPREIDFSSGFTLERDMCVCLNISDEFCNTFLVESPLIFISKKDCKEDYTESRMRFRNKANDMALIAKIKEHQKELLEELIESQTSFYKTHSLSAGDEPKEKSNTIKYERSSEVPRSDRIVLDWERLYILVPFLSHSIPFHISLIKNASVINASEGTKLRINFKETKEIEASGNTLLKSISVRAYDAEAVLVQINEMKKEFSKPKIRIEEQGELKEKYKRVALTELYVRTDSKMAVKKTLNNLEIHENGFKYGEMIILFSNIKNIFFKSGDVENPALIHFNLKAPQMYATKLTSNFQFFRKNPAGYHETNKRENEYTDMIHQEEEEAEIERINDEFGFFSDKIEQETPYKVQIPERGFLGVHAKEAAQICYTSDALVALHEQPFFVLNFDEIEVVNFERVTFVTKTFDCVFVFKNKMKPVAFINAIEMTKLMFVKELLDSQNILFMETKININWQNLMATIMENPLSFYENGGWTELLKEEKEAESEEIESESDSETEASTVGSTTSSEAESSSVEESEDEEGSSVMGSDSEADSEDYESESDSEDKKSKKRRK
ncbi:hypothetical protein ENBRE01_1272 [Enteropsectra breve]|nr:hypothetical protein ENBRE01_1272 [Enteropsectra breve]